MASSSYQTAALGYNDPTRKTIRSLEREVAHLTFKSDQMLARLAHIEQLLEKLTEPKHFTGPM